MDVGNAEGVFLVYREERLNSLDLDRSLEDWVQHTVCYC
jgi:hypothetical protein